MHILIIHPGHPHLDLAQCNFAAAALVFLQFGLAKTWA